MKWSLSRSDRSRSGKSRSPRPRTAASRDAGRRTLRGLEHLELRHLMDGKMQLSFDSTYQVPYLEIRGTLAHDQVRVERTTAGEIKASLYSGDTGLTQQFLLAPTSGVRLGYIFFNGSAGNDYFVNETSIPTLVMGGSGNDILIGGFGPDEIMGMDGHDDIYGRGSIDILSGGRGSDTISAGDGDDYVSDPEGFNKIYGGAGDDWLEGGLGQDAIFGGDDDDVLLGNKGLDYLNGGNGDDYLFGGDDGQIDELWGTAGRDRFEVRQSPFSPEDLEYLVFYTDDDWIQDFNPKSDRRYEGSQLGALQAPPHKVWEAAVRTASVGSASAGFAGASYIAGPSGDSDAEGPFSLSELWAYANSLDAPPEFEVRSVAEEVSYFNVPDFDGSQIILADRYLDFSEEFDWQIVAFDYQMTLRELLIDDAAAARDEHGLRLTGLDEAFSAAGFDFAPLLAGDASVFDDFSWSAATADAAFDEPLGDEPLEEVSLFDEAYAEAPFEDDPATWSALNELSYEEQFAPSLTGEEISASILLGPPTSDAAPITATRYRTRVRYF